MITYRFLELEQTIRDAMDSVSLQKIRQFADRSKRWLAEYINGLPKEQRAFAGKQYKCIDGNIVSKYEGSLLSLGFPNIV